MSVHEPAFDVRFVCGDGDDDLLCAGVARTSLHPGICRGLRSGIGLRIPARRLAVRVGGGHLGAGGVPEMVAGGKEMSAVLAENMRLETI